MPPIYLGLLPKTQIIFPHNFAQKLQGFISVPYSIPVFHQYHFSLTHSTI